MSGQISPDNLLAFFKALADENRIKIVGLLSQSSYTVEQLAELLRLRPSTVSHHLSRLAEAGLVRARAESYYNVYELQTGALEDLARSLLAGESLPAAAADVDLGAYDRKVVADFTTPDGRLKTIPAQRKKLEVILRHVVQAFERDQRYTEAQVNEILSRFHKDTASLRRELVGSHLLRRDSSGGAYWRPPENE
jgi:DNA-binding HxlR family transcriptional regulator